MCGLGAIVNRSVQKLNKSVYNIIGIANDARGGDSCGIFIDKKVEYGIDKTKLYQDFFYESKLLEETTECHLAFLHCRKASPGLKKDLASAQPVVIEEDGEVKYVLMHNGTIYNTDALAKKYIPDVNIKGMTDSQVMARIFYYSGYDALAEYNGSAVFIIADYRENPNKPRVFIWKGYSKDTQYGKTSSDERPIYLVSTTTSIILSSIALQLDAMYGEQYVKTIEANALIEIDDNKLWIIDRYNRDSQCQARAYSSSYGKANNSNNASNEYEYDWDNYDDDYYGYANGSYSGNSYVYINPIGEFMSGRERLHGRRYVSASGSVFVNKMSTPAFKEVWFYQGVLLYSKECFDTIELIRKHFSKKDPTLKSSEEFVKNYGVIVAYFSYLPLKITDKEKYWVVNDNLLWEAFTGKFYNVLGNYYIKECREGNVICNTYGNSTSNFEHFKGVADGFYFDKNYFIDLVNKAYNESIQLGN